MDNYVDFWRNKTGQTSKTDATEKLQKYEKKNAMKTGQHRWYMKMEPKNETNSKKLYDKYNLTQDFK